MTKTQKLAEKIQKIYKSNKRAIDALPTRGPRGGTNARIIAGWRNYENGTITRAALMTDMPVMNYWSGKGPTPSSALPAVCYGEILAAYKRIFDK